MGGFFFCVDILPDPEILRLYVHYSVLLIIICAWLLQLLFRDRKKEKSLKKHLLRRPKLQNFDVWFVPQMARKRLAALYVLLCRTEGRFVFCFLFLSLALSFSVCVCVCACSDFRESRNKPGSSGWLILF